MGKRKSDSNPERAAPQKAVKEDLETTRERILQAATTLIAEQGYAATPISQISKLSGAHHASIYWAFESKEGLLAAVIDRCSQQYFELVSNSIANASGLEEAMRGMIRPLTEGSDFIRLLLILALERRDGNPEVFEAAMRVRTKAVSLMAEKFSALEGITERFSAKDILALSRSLLMMFDGLFIATQIDGPSFSIEDALRFSSAIFRASIDAILKDEFG